MDSLPIVATFCSSPRLRETLSVLLEHDCTLHFASAPVPTGPAPDLAVVATPDPAALLRRLPESWPGLPIVAVDLAAAAAASPDRITGGSVLTVPLEPHAIRGAVLRVLARDADAVLRRTIPPLVDGLRQEIAYASVVVRTLASRAAPGVDDTTAAIFGTIMREQSHVLDQIRRVLDAFLARPRYAPPTLDFVAQLRQRLATRTVDDTSHQIVSEPATNGACGPTVLVPLLAQLVLAHIRGRAVNDVIHLQATRPGIVLRYAPRPATQVPRASWLLRLAAVALQTSAWEIVAAQHRNYETVMLRPISTRTDQ